MVPNPYLSTMRYKFSHLLIVLLMVLSQSAVAVHDVEHQGYEHSDQCRAFLGGEQSATVASSLAVAVPTEYVERYQSLPSSTYSLEVLLSYSPRAPPTFS